MTTQVFRWNPDAKGTCVLVCRECAAGHADVGREVERYDYAGGSYFSFLPSSGYVNTLGRSFRWKCWTCKQEQPHDGPTWSVVIEDDPA